MMLISFPCNYFKLHPHSNMIQYARSNDFINGTPVKPSASVRFNGDQCKPNCICCVVLLRCNPTQFLLHSTSNKMCIVVIPQDGLITLCGAYFFIFPHLLPLSPKVLQTEANRVITWRGCAGK